VKIPNTILLVEDDIDDQYLFQEALNLVNPSISCIVAQNGAVALEVIDHTPPFDVIFMDLNMPKINGFECLKLLKGSKKHRNIPVVILSTSQNEKDIDQCTKLGATSYLVKPISIDVLFRKLKEVLVKIL
jgi:CheY-like chemotaxis protein